jgi:hypothetical protein
MKKCRICKESFQPFNSTAYACSPECALTAVKASIAKKHAKAVREGQKRDKQALRTRKDALKGKAYYLKSAQQSVNAWVRLRDTGKPCISCGKPDDGTHQRHASHFRSVKACSSQRYSTKNIFASCRVCNEILSGNLLEYRQRLEVIRPGLPEWLECQNDIVRYDIDYLKRLKKVFDKRIRQRKRLKGLN